MSRQSVAPTAHTRIRTAPVQQRSTDRVTLLLNAAAALIDEKGIDGLTTSEVAARSDSSVGVVYRYFPNIQFLLRALAIRNLERFMDRAFPPESLVNGTWLSRLDEPFVAYVELARTEPSFRLLRFGSVIDERFAGHEGVSPEENVNRELVTRITAVMHGRYDGLHASDALLLDIEVGVETSMALLHRAFADDPHGDERYIDKATTIMRELLAGHAHEVPAR
jgi:AcrR family transcriptional regulator